ncbi:MAG TPA: MlaD family protein [Candidatus Limnocylindria bacterium]|nr:MlaD family protein [Candidatus Limnocylindria bacterium]
MKNSLETRLGLFFALVVIAALLLLEMIGSGGLFSHGKAVRAQFTSARDLKVGDPVKLAGVSVGRVKSIKLKSGKVEVTMSVDPDAEVHTDSLATVQFTVLMGQNFVALTFGSEKAPLADSNTVLESKEQPDLAAIMAKLDLAADGVQNMTKSFSGEEFSKLLGPFTDFIKQNQPRLAAILGNMQNISTLIAEGKGTVGKLVVDDTLYQAALSTVTNLNSAVADVRPLAEDAKAAVAEARQMISGVNKGEGTVGKLLKDEKLYSETTVAMTNLKEILQKINTGNGTVGQLVNDGAFLKNVKLTLQKVDKATEGLEDTGPLTVLSSVVGNLF